jgi:hypothetical protein
VVLLVALVIWERRARNPMLPLRVVSRLLPRVGPRMLMLPGLTMAIVSPGSYC